MAILMWLLAILAGGVALASSVGIGPFRGMVFALAEGPFHGEFHNLLYVFIISAASCLVFLTAGIGLSGSSGSAGATGAASIILRIVVFAVKAVLFLGLLTVIILFMTVSAALTAGTHTVRVRPGDAVRIIFR